MQNLIEILKNFAKILRIFSPENFRRKKIKRVPILDFSASHLQSVALSGVRCGGTSCIGVPYILYVAWQRQSQGVMLLERRVNGTRLYVLFLFWNARAHCMQ